MKEVAGMKEAAGPHFCSLFPRDTIITINSIISKRNSKNKQQAP